MPCSACAKKNQQGSVQKKTLIATQGVQSSCNYTADTTNAWIDTLQCVSDKTLLTNFGIQKALYNSFLGILLSIRRSPTTVCYFTKELDIIQPYILNILNSDVC